jgi:Holliday junction resolvasome RuvABC endonuclease subunit
MSKKILSIDPSLNSLGYCIFEDGVLYDFGVLAHSKDLDQYIRIHHILEDIEKIIKEEDITQVVIEGLSYNSISISVRVLGAIYFSILIICYKYGIEWDEITPLQVKKFATGSGKAKKQDMWKALSENVQQKIEQKYKTVSSGKYDICDAYWIGEMYLENIK